MEEEEEEEKDDDGGGPRRGVGTKEGDQDEMSKGPRGTERERPRPPPLRRLIPSSLSSPRLLERLDIYHSSSLLSFVVESFTMLRKWKKKLGCGEGRKFVESRVVT